VKKLRRACLLIAFKLFIISSSFVQYAGNCKQAKPDLTFDFFFVMEGLLRVDRKFRTYGSLEDKTEYHKRPLIEDVNSFLKTQFSMANNKVRGLAQVTFYALCSILCLVLNREAAQRISRHEKAVSPTYFNT
jgi:hypothetical protein